MRSFPLAVLCVLATLAASTSSVPAETWPQRTVRLITPFSSGSAIDFAARLFADRLAARWGKPVIVENRPGGDTIIGVAAFAAQRDDHTLLFAGATTFTVTPVINDKLPYDTDRDLTPISPAADVFISIAVTASLKANTLAELVQLARARPGTLNWTAGPGLPQYVFSAFLKQQGLSMATVSYREFASALQDLAEGRIHVVVLSVTSLLPQAQAGKARFIAMCSRQRAPIAAEVPTAGELGHPELVMDGFSGFYGWRDMPSDLRERIAADVRAVAADPWVRERLEKVGQAPRVASPEEFAATLASGRARISEIVQLVGTKPTQ